MYNSKVLALTVIVFLVIIASCNNKYKLNHADNRNS